MTPENEHPGESAERTILIVEDEPDICSAYARWLDDEFTVRIAHTGAEARAVFDEAIDIVLLDRRLPDLAGEELLPDLREKHPDCRVAIISTMEPDFDIIEFGFDLYLEKPITDPNTLRDAVLTLLQRSEFDAKLQEFLSQASKKATLEATKSQAELGSSEEYETLLARLENLRCELDDVTGSLDDDDLRVAFSHTE